MPCRATQDRRVMVEISDKTRSTGEGNGKPLQYSCLKDPMNSMKRQKDRTLKDELFDQLYVTWVTYFKFLAGTLNNREIGDIQFNIFLFNLM